jgi:hypothetical protein
LCAVVQVASDPAAGLVCGSDQSCPRGDQLGAIMGRRDRGRQELGEFRHAEFGVGRQRPLLGPDGDHPPQSTVDVDGHPGAAAQSFLEVGLAAGYVAVVVDAGGCAGALDGRGQAGGRIVLPRVTHIHVRARGPFVGQHRCRSVRLEADHPGGAGPEVAEGFFGDRVEHRFRGCAVGDEHGNAPQRRLGLGEVTQLVAVIGGLPG